MGKPGFPIPPPGGWVWEGVALPGRMFIPSVRGAAAWTADMKKWGNQVPPYPRPAHLRLTQDYRDATSVTACGAGCSRSRATMSRSMYSGVSVGA